MVKVKSRNQPSRPATFQKQAFLANIEGINENTSIAESTPADILEGPKVLSKANVQLTAAGTVHQRKTNPLKADRKRFSSLTQKNKKQALKFVDRKKLKDEHIEMKKQERVVRDMIREERIEEVNKAKQRKEQKEENERRGMVVQQITNTKKLKKLTPKQMKNIMKM